MSTCRDQLLWEFITEILIESRIYLWPSPVFQRVISSVSILVLHLSLPAWVNCFVGVTPDGLGAVSRGCNLSKVYLRFPPSSHWQEPSVSQLFGRVRTSRVVFITSLLECCSYSTACALYLPTIYTGLPPIILLLITNHILPDTLRNSFMQSRAWEAMKQCCEALNSSLIQFVCQR